MRIVGRKSSNIEQERTQESSIDVLDSYIKIQGIDSKLVTIPTIVTSLNEDGTIRQEKSEPNAYEIVEKNKDYIG